MGTKLGHLAILTLIAAALFASAKESEAVTCNVAELSPCLAAFTSPSEPTSTCCDKLKEQGTCLCEYAKNPSYSHYVDSPQAKKVASTCKVTVQC